MMMLVFEAGLFYRRLRSDQISLKTVEISRFQRHLRFDEPGDEVTRAIEFGIEPLTQSFRIETSTPYNGTSIRLDEPQLILSESDHILAFFARNCADAVDYCPYLLDQCRSRSHELLLVSSQVFYVSHRRVGGEPGRYAQSGAWRIDKHLV